MVGHGLPKADSRFGWSVVAVALLVVGVGCGSNSSPSSSSVATMTLPGPAGVAFYTPPSPLPAGTPGEVIWTRPLVGSHVLPDAASDTLVLYHSTAVRDGSDVAESAMVAMPKGEPPPGGWPVIAFAHGDVGAADSCVVSGDNGPTYPSHESMTTYDPILNDWVKRGYVVVRPDYEGLGTPEPNPNGVGESMANSMVDSVRAARNLDSNVGARWAAIGHSHGGRGALFSTSIAADRAPELTLVGTVSMAPLSASASRLRTWTADPNAPLLDGNFPQQLYGAAAAYSDVRPDQFLTPTGLTMDTQAGQLCQADLLTAWFGKHSGAIFRAGADLQALYTAFDKNEPATLHLGTNPVLVAQGLADIGIVPATTESLVQSLQANGATDITYRTYPNANHLGVVAASQADVQQWVEARFADHPAAPS